MYEIDKNIEKSNEQKSWAIAIGLHAIFFILSGIGLFSCWKMPDPIQGAGEISVVFGKQDFGSGNNIEVAENPVENPSENPAQETPQEIVQEQSSSTQNEQSSFTDPDSDISSKDITKESTTGAITGKSSENNSESNTKPTKESENNKDKVDTKPKEVKPNVKANSTMGGGAEGGGNDDKLGKEGNPNAVLKGDKSGGSGNSDKGEGPGLKIDGWAFNQDPAKPSITTPGIAKIKFTINSFGKILTAKVIGGAFSANERKIIVAEFKKISLRKTSNDGVYKSSYSGIYDWNLQY